MRTLPHRLRHPHALLAGLLVIVGVVRIVLTYPVFSQTYDEPCSIARGLEWLSHGRYSYVHHPPLAPVLCSLGPFLSGSVYHDCGTKWASGNHALYHGDRPYLEVLAAARAGNLVFFVAACITTYVLAHSSTKNAGTALLAVLLFSSLPLVLGHAAVATTDMAITATFAWMMFSSMRWFETATVKTTFSLAVITAIAFLSKFSAIPFAAAGWCALFLARKIGTGEPRLDFRQVGHLAGLFLFWMTVSAFVIWIGYLGSFGRIGDVPSVYYSDVAVRESVLAEAFEQISYAAIPAPEFVRGIGSVALQETHGQASYFLDRRRQNAGSVGFFPTLLAVKTPLVCLALFAVGSGVSLVRSRDHSRPSPWRCLCQVLIPILIVAIVMPSDINLGLRHILPIFPFVAVSAAIGLHTIWDRLRPTFLRRPVAIGLLLLHLGPSFACHPDYLAYFNCLAGDRPETIAVDSDLDWGQDLLRLSAELRRRRVDGLWIAYFGTAELERHDLPKFERLPPGVGVDGFVAISLTLLMIDEGYSWLAEHQPIARVGSSILLFEVSTVEDAD